MLFLAPIADSKEILTNPNSTSNQNYYFSIHGYYMGESLTNLFFEIKKAKIQKFDEKTPPRSWEILGKKPSVGDTGTKPCTS